MLSKEKIEQYRKKLEEEKAKLLKEIKEYGQPVDFGGDIEDASEEADEAEELGNRLAIAKVKKSELEEVETALKKIQEGTYGICNNCGGEISEGVLAVAPESVLCANCKKAK